MLHRAKENRAHRSRREQKVEMNCLVGQWRRSERKAVSRTNLAKAKQIIISGEQSSRAKESDFTGNVTRKEIRKESSSIKQKRITNQNEPQESTNIVKENSDNLRERRMS